MHRQEVGIYIVSSVALCKEIRVEEKNYNLIQPSFVVENVLRKHVVKL